MARFMSMVDQLIAEGEAPLPPTLVDGLQALAEDYDRSTPFTPMGDRLVRTDLARTVRQRRAFDLLPPPRPETDAPCVVIVSLPRTGSTMLHNLFALDPSTSTVSLTRALWPFAGDVDAGAGAGAGVNDVSVLTELHLAMLDRLSPMLRTFHPMEAAWPEECVTLLQLTGLSERSLGPASAPTYERFLDSTPAAASYRDLRAMLAAIDPGSTRWVLKSAHHLGQLDVVDEVLAPQAYLWVHRDPLSSLASQCRLTDHGRRAVAGVVDRDAIGREQLARYVRVLDRAIDAAPGLRAPMIHASYRETVDAPIGLLERCYAALGWALPPDIERRADAWLAQTAAAANQPPARLEDYGLSAGAAAEALSRYRSFAEPWLT